ncbi:MAG: PilZ domain-containing protein [Gammaproteobacteria bacterium]|jgi:type IV pilus assembly protein PilZ|nr:PilZ domain-containing protein [Gammaproteobacteria bacterium]
MAEKGRGITTVSIKDKGSLYAAYMPFVKNGGLFVATRKPHKIGDDVFILLSIMEENERLPIAGKVVWVTPEGAQGNRTPGIGVQFSSQDRGQTRNKIEGLLAGALTADRPTNTM